MGVKPVRGEDAKALGLIPDAETAQDIKEAVDDHHLEGLNNNLEVFGEGLNMRESVWRAIKRIIPTDNKESGTLS